MPDNLRLLQLHHHQLLSYAEPENQRLVSDSQAAARPGAASAGWRYLAEGGSRATVQLLIHCIQPVQEGGVRSRQQVLGASQEVLGGTDALCLNLEATLTSQGQRSNEATWFISSQYSITSCKPKTDMIAHREY